MDASFLRLVFLAIAFVAVESGPIAQNANTRFLPPLPQHHANPNGFAGTGVNGKLVGGAGLGGAGIFGLYNLFTGNDQINVKPVVGLGVNEHGEIAPEVALSTTIGDGPGPKPVFNVGGKLGSQGINPFATGGVAVGDGPISGTATSGFALGSNGQVHSQVSGGVGIGQGFDLFRPTNGQGIGGLNFGRR